LLLAVDRSGLGFCFDTRLEDASERGRVEMKRDIFLGRRFWRALGLVGVWGLLGGGIVGFLAEQPLGGVFLIVCGVVLLGVLIDGRLIKERKYTSVDLLIFLAAIAIVLLAILPLLGGLLARSWLWLFYLVVLAALMVFAGFEAWRAVRARR
jgi:drug/metabolite transporter (DMT)-like permease